MKQTLAAVGIAILGLTWAARAAAQPTDHLVCYKVKDPQAKAMYTANLAVGGVNVQAGCTIKVPAAMTCLPVSKTNVTPPPPGGGGIGWPNSFNCYKVKCPNPPFSAVFAQDQFGLRFVTVKTTRLLCAPIAGATDGGFPATGQTLMYTAVKDGGGAPVPVQDDGTVKAGGPLGKLCVTRPTW
jgi:hypothetical protein